MADRGAVIIDHEPEVTGQFRSRRFVEVLARSIFITITMDSPTARRRFDRSHLGSRVKTEKPLVNADVVGSLRTTK